MICIIFTVVEGEAFKAVTAILENLLNCSAYVTHYINTTHTPAQVLIM